MEIEFEKDLKINKKEEKEIESKFKQFLKWFIWFNFGLMIGMSILYLWKY